MLQTMNWQAFFSMGGYGLYVWISYGLTALLLMYNLIAHLQRKQAITRQVKACLEQENRKRGKEAQA